MGLYLGNSSPLKLHFKGKTYLLNIPSYISTTNNSQSLYSGEDILEDEEDNLAATEEDV